MNEIENNNASDTIETDNKKLSVIQIRILGCLIEKEISTPEYYPLTLKALMAACNQKSNRDPVMLIDEPDIIRTLEDLRYDHQLVRLISAAGSRVPKYQHIFQEHFDFTPQATAILCELFLRGPQTPGGLRTHTHRLYQFESLAEVDETLKALTEWEDGPFVVQLPREPGCREQRWAHLFSGEIEFDESTIEARPEPARLVVQAENERIEALEAELASLREEVTRLNADFAEFRKQFE